MTDPLHADDSPAIRVLAAGSLRAAINEMATAFTRSTGITVQAGFGASGALRQRIEGGEAADVFASADMGNPLTLSRAGKTGPVVLFARNRLCALVRAGLALTPDTFLATLLDPEIKLGTSTPKTDPLGDYTWAMFGKADALRPGSRAALEAKAKKLIGGPPLTSPPPAGIDPFAWYVREGHADVFIEYCSAGPSFQKDLPGASVIDVPLALGMGADYGITILPTKNTNAASFAMFVLSPDGQAILAQNGFEAPLLPPHAR